MYLARGDYRGRARRGRRPQDAGARRRPWASTSPASRRRPRSATPTRRRRSNSALELQPDAADALAALARLHVSAGHPGARPAVIEQALARSPHNFAARNLLGELQLASKEYGPAQQEFTKVVAAAPEWPLGWRNLALAQLAANDRAGAVATLEKGVVEGELGFLAGRRSCRALRAQSANSTRPLPTTKSWSRSAAASKRPRTTSPCCS